MPTRQELFSPANAFIQGQAARQQYDAGQTRNALAQMELQNAQREMASRNKLMDLQVQGQQQTLNAEQAKFAYAQLKQAMDSGNPKAFVLQNIPLLASKLGEQGIDLQSMDDQTATQLVDGLARKYAGEAGVLPAAPMSAQGKIGADVRGGYLTQEQANAALNPGMSPYQQERLNIERQKLSQRPQDTGPLVQVAGPDGNPVYRTREEAVGQPAYVARDKPAAADLKYQRELKSKQPRLQAAIRRVERLAEAAQSIAKNSAFDGGPLDQYAINWTKQGQELEQAAASLTPELTALTRVPGIGSQSDLETRLAGLQFPSSRFSPEVNAKAVAELQAFMRDLQDVYGSALEPSGAEPPTGAARRTQGQAPAEAIEYLRQNPQFKGAFRQKYGYLPDGL